MRLQELINEILDLSKIESGMMEFNYAPVSLYILCEDVKNTYSFRCQPGVELVFEESDPSLVISTDRNRLFQVFSNLIGNATKFTAKGSISFGYKLKEKEIVFHVADTGSGISDDKIDKIFDRFIMANNQVQGTGLGLSISKIIVEKLGGKIAVQSKMGTGTTFTFTLPYISANGDMKWEEKLTPASIKDNNRTSHQEMTILVAEDYQSNYDLIEAMLGKMYKLVHAHDGMEAIIFYEQYKPDLILMDIKMPNINGLDATKAIREMSASVPVIAVSAYAYEKDKIAAIESGCNEFLTKPVSAVYKFAYFLSILFTIFILGLSIFAYFSGKINPVENMFAAYVALSKPILVVVNTILFIYWLIRLRYWLWIPLTGLIVNYEYITSMYQIYNPTKYANENRLKVVTYNVHSFGNEITGFSAKEFAEMMNKEETDVLCFQEYRGNGDFTEQDLQNTYAKIFPYSFIPEGLSQAIYSRYPIRQSQTIEFPNTNNGAIWADLDVKGMTIRIINVHMQTTSFDRMRSKAAQARGEQDEEQERGIYLGYSDNFRENTVRRAGQAEQISSLINATEYPLIVCGDFNDPPGTFTYETLKNGLKDGFQTAGEGYGATYRGFHHLLRIDYLFHSTLLEGIKYKVIPYDMSDHNPVYLEVGL